MATPTARAKGGFAARDAVARRLRGGGTDWRSFALEGVLLISILAALGVLLVLLADIVLRAIPLLVERPVDFLTSPVSARPDRAASRSAPKPVPRRLA